MKEQMINAGGKLWEKGDMVRIYLNSDAVKNLVSQSSYSDMEEKSLKKAKTFFDVKTGELKSDVGTVRVMLNRAGFKCSK